jgi:indolepyruvate ferredoxin oxidoreductase beta subunit
MAETGRALQKGFVTPNKTTLIASSHRLYSVIEKSALGNGIIDQSTVVEIAGKASKKFICFDMEAAATATGSLISSVLLGAIAACGVLPFDRSAFETSIRNAGTAVDANLLGFAAGYDGASKNSSLAFPVSASSDAVQMPAAIPAGANGAALASRIDAEFPQPVRNIALHGALLALDYQDPEYAASYLDLLNDVRQTDGANDGEAQGHALTTEVARQLALQMCYEDTIRVADLKTRGDRFGRIRAHAAARPQQPVHIVEYFNPRLEEICDTLPVSLGAFILRSESLRKVLSPFFGKGRNVKTTSITGFLLLYLLAKFTRFRRGTYRFSKQQKLIRDWLERISAAAGEDYEYAVSIARCIEIVKGYGDTYERGLTRYRAIIEAVDRSGSTNRADIVCKLQRAALTDEKGLRFKEALAE